MREFLRDEERHKQGEEKKKTKKWEKGGKRVMEETVRADGEQAYSDKWRE